MEMIEVKTAELVGPALDWAVAHAIGHKPRTGHGCAYPVEIIDWNRPGTQVNACRFEPSTDWSQGGPLISQFGIELRPLMGNRWSACAWENGRRVQGDSAEQAICRAIVAAKLGDTVRVPAVLVEGEA